MGSRLREKPERLFQVFVEIAKPEGENEAPFIIQQYPPDFDDKETMMMIPKFAYPCKTDSSQVDHFTFVMTDLDSMFRFGYCRHANGGQTCLCILSCLPWYEIFFKLLNLLAEITNRTETSHCLEFLKITYENEVPLPKVPVTIVACEEMFSFTAPDPNTLAKIPDNRNLTEYYNAVDAMNMMHIFASMLHERRIYMTSRKLSRLTACIHAAESLLYPMHWQHLYIPVLPAHLVDYISAPMPYLIGVHCNILETCKIQAADIGDAVVVDLDNNTVTSCYDDLSNLPSDVTKYLRNNLKPDIVKNQMDAIPRAFLQALVRLIGGYREGIKRRNEEPITFDPEAFVRSRTSLKTQAFLESMLACQIFQQFIYGRLEILNNFKGGGFTDIFEQQATLYADKKKTGLGKGFTKHKKKGKEMFNGLRVKAAPMMSTAVHSVKVQGKKAFGLFSSSPVQEEEKRNNSFQPTGGVVHSRQTMKKVNTDPGQLKPARPPPPQGQSQERPNSILRQTLSGEDTTDDLRLSYHTVDMTLMNDDDIQAMMRSASAEVLPSQQILQESSESSSESSSEDDEDEDDNDSEIITFDKLMNEDEAGGLLYIDDEDPSDEPIIDMKPAPPIPDKTYRSCTGDKLVLTRPLPPPAPVAPPRWKRNNRSSPNFTQSAVFDQMSDSSASALQAAPKPLPRSSSLRNEAGVRATGTVNDAPLIEFDSNETDGTVSDLFDPLASKQNAPQQSSDSFQMRPSPIQRNSGSRSSLTRTKAFRRESLKKPMRSGCKEDEPCDSLDSADPMSSFDPLADISRVSLKGSQSSSGRTSDPAVNRSRTNSDLLMQEWSLTSLPKAPTIVLPVTPHPPGHSFGQPQPFQPVHGLNNSQWSTNTPKGVSLFMTPRPYTGSQFSDNFSNQSIPKQQTLLNQTTAGVFNQQAPVKPVNQIPSISTSQQVMATMPYNSSSTSSLKSSSLTTPLHSTPNLAPATGTRPLSSTGSPFISGSFRHVQCPPPKRTSLNTNSTVKTPNKPSDDLFSEFLPQFSSGSSSQNNRQGSPSPQNTPAVKVPPPRPPQPNKNWATFE